MAKFVLFPEIAIEMAKRGENQQDLANLLQLDRTTVTRKLNGEIEWSIGDIEVMCLHYDKDFYVLFRKNVKEEGNENTIKN